MPKRTPFFDVHREAGAKMIDFGGYEMPVHYSGIRREHQAVREHAGIFDVSHMGEFFISGDKAEALLQHITVNDVSKLVPGKAQYNAMCYPDGGIVDDLIVYKLADDRFMMVVNASNREKDLEWVTTNNPMNALVEDLSNDMCLLAVQGPKAESILQKITGTPLSEISFYTFATGRLAGFDGVIISATGYTGERGFELYFDQRDADPRAIWAAIMHYGVPEGLEPAGLGARDTLRLEMGYALYGNDISRDTNTIEAGLGWITKLAKGDFIGREILAKVKQTGPARKLCGFVMAEDRAIPRQGYEILSESGDVIGAVTSGTQSITSGAGVGMGYVKTEFSGEGTNIMIRVRNRDVPAGIKKPPFIRK
ncbi:MAG: glycine cleavage system aminomethyltransferase GcvT [Cyclonatronaceae bacterium]